MLCFVSTSQALTHNLPALALLMPSSDLICNATHLIRKKSRSSAVKSQSNLTHNQPALLSPPTKTNTCFKDLKQIILIELKVLFSPKTMGDPQDLLVLLPGLPVSLIWHLFQKSYHFFSYMV